MCLAAKNEMQDNIFIDTNIWIYYFLDSDNEEDKIKKKKSEELLNSINGNIIVSNQIINELSNTFSRKFNIESAKIKEFINDILDIADICIITLQTTFESLDIQEKYKYSFFDSLILATCFNNDCNIVYSEDLQHNQKIDNKLLIINPFI